MNALRGTRRGEQPRERESPLELEFYMQGKTDWGSQDSAPLLESWVTIHVEGNPLASWWTVAPNTLF